MINLDEHKFFDHETKQEVVPLTVALEAVADAYDNSLKVEVALDRVKKALSNLNSEVND